MGNLRVGSSQGQGGGLPDAGGHGEATLDGKAGWGRGSSEHVQAFCPP